MAARKSRSGRTYRTSLVSSIALAYLSATDPEAAKRARQFVMEEMTATKLRHQRVHRAKPVQLWLPLLETAAERLWRHRAPPLPGMKKAPRCRSALF